MAHSCFPPSLPAFISITYSTPFFMINDFPKFKYLPVPLPYPELSSDFLLQSQLRGMRGKSGTGNDNQFLDIVDIDKNSFVGGSSKLAGMGWEGETRKIGGFRTGTGVDEGSKRPISVRIPERRSGGMSARLEALAEQLDEVEQSAYALQHDLAFSFKVLLPPLASHSSPSPSLPLPLAYYLLLGGKKHGRCSERQF